MNWLKQALTGADNKTVAIGRLIGIAISFVLLLVLPVWAAGAISGAHDDIARKAQSGSWHELFEALAIYVPIVAAAVGGLIWGTNSTEPTAKNGD